MNKVLAVFVLLMTSMLDASGQVAQKIDTAIEFANAGRGDLALQQFQRLLQTSLTPVEKASVLYNSAVVFASLDRFWEAILALNQIDDDMFDRVVKASPAKALRIAYNGALCSVGFARKQLLKLASASYYEQKELDAVSEALNAAHHYSRMLDTLSANKVVADISLPSIARTQLQEDIANLTWQLTFYQQRAALEQLDKPALLDTLGGLLQQQFFALLPLYLADTLNDVRVGLYMQAYREQQVGIIIFAIDRLLLYLQAPAKAKVAAMHAFFEEELLLQKKALQKAFDDEDIAQALSTLDELSASVMLIQAETANTEVVTMLDMRTAIAMRVLLAKKSLQGEPKLRSFWQSQWQQLEQFFARFLAKKASLSDEMNASLLALLQKRLSLKPSALPDVELTFDDTFYWKILSQAENTTYLALATLLHGAIAQDPVLITKMAAALLDRVGLLPAQAQATALLTKMLGQDSRLLQFQDVVESWMYVDQKSAFSFLLGLLSDECTNLHLKPDSDSFTARTDYHLLLHLLSLISKTEGVEIVGNDLMQRSHWFTDKEKNELDFFAISLDLGWLKEMLTGNVEDLKGITNAVDFGVDFQKKTMALVRFAQKPEFQPLFDLLAQMQEKLIHTINGGLNKLKAKGPKIKQVIALMAHAQAEVAGQNKELAKLQAVLNDLEEASKILHSMRSERDESQSSSSDEAPKPNASLEPLQNRAIKLAPELSIRLLQEMQQQDKSLQTQSLPQATGTRPW